MQEDIKPPSTSPSSAKSWWDWAAATTASATASLAATSPSSSASAPLSSFSTSPPSTKSGHMPTAANASFISEASTSGSAFTLAAGHLRERLAPLQSPECVQCGVLDPDAPQLDCGHSPYCREHFISLNLETFSQIFCPCSHETVVNGRTIAHFPPDKRRRKRIIWMREHSELSYSQISLDESSSLLGSVLGYSLVGPDGFQVLKALKDLRKNMNADFYLKCHVWGNDVQREVADWILSHYALPDELLVKPKKLQQMLKTELIYVPVVRFKVRLETDYVVDVPQSLTSDQATSSSSSTFTASSAIMSGYGLDYVSQLLPNRARPLKWKSVEGKNKNQYRDLLQVSTWQAVDTKLLHELLEMEGTFSYGTMTKIEPDQLKEYPIDSTMQDEIPNRHFSVLDFEKSEEECWDDMIHEVILSEKKVIEDLVKSEHPTGHQQRELEYMVKILDKRTDVILLPVFVTKYSHNGVEYQALSSGFRSRKLVGNTPPRTSLSEIGSRVSKMWAPNRK